MFFLLSFVVLSMLNKQFASIDLETARLVNEITHKTVNFVSRDSC